MRETVRFLLMETLRNHEGMGARQAREILARAYTCQGRTGNMVRGVASLVVLSKIFPVSDKWGCPGRILPDISVRPPRSRRFSEWQALPKPRHNLRAERGSRHIDGCANTGICLKWRICKGTAAPWKTGAASKIPASKVTRPSPCPTCLRG
uniref:Uncharacterized protein n=1 Tax=Candidatus Kentrum sp. UNK TaxID=2126344 RepID=A0A451AXL1_9GAMM|nr:MAG: hypothetical protein BECKUNK1418G_GA0071005_103133 [Candidatus Kentron sp. UNK]VFK70799.1 MAG: hypothetical protein BECKUNK1418H_GA0071006_103832 [Candidatus Kentron sp. UNK]